MKQEFIMSFDIEDGKMVGQKNEGELIRCGQCRYSYTDKVFKGLYCKGIRKSPMQYCDGGMRREEA